MKNQYIQVEYDTSYWGGDYHNVGVFAYLSLDAIVATRNKGKSRAMTWRQAVRKVFRKVIGVDPVHIVHYSFDKLYDKEGNLIAW